jgi:hypothetical protein
MERAYQRSDASYDGVFYLGVRTTGILCRPSCPAKKPKGYGGGYRLRRRLAEGRAAIRPNKAVVYFSVPVLAASRAPFSSARAPARMLYKP